MNNEDLRVKFEVELDIDNFDHLRSFDEDLPLDVNINYIINVHLINDARKNINDQLLRDTYIGTRWWDLLNIEIMPTDETKKVIRRLGGTYVPISDTARHAGNMISNLTGDRAYFEVPDMKDMIECEDMEGYIKHMKGVKELVDTGYLAFSEYDRGTMVKLMKYNIE